MVPSVFSIGGQPSLAERRPRDASYPAERRLVQRKWHGLCPWNRVYCQRGSVDDTPELLKAFSGVGGLCGLSTYYIG
jgi:hypothetical protein